jgi:serine/threonine protein kinase
MRSIKRADVEPIPGYRLLEPLGRGGFGEVWKCEAPGGLFKAVKFVAGPGDGPDPDTSGLEQELKALNLIKAIRHPFLLSIERVEIIGGELVIVMELADQSLHDRLLECQAAGKPGLPRDELLGYMREAAEVLDLISLRYELQHLDVKPGNLFLISNHVKVADFGLVNHLSGTQPSNPAAQESGGISPLYAAPERFQGVISPSTDQYSLAVVYQELLTGRRPFNGKNLSQLLLQHTVAEPDLSLLPQRDRAAVARALSKDSRERFATCQEFVATITASSLADMALGRVAGDWPESPALVQDQPSNREGPSGISVTARSGPPGLRGQDGNGPGPAACPRPASTADLRLPAGAADGQQPGRPAPPPSGWPQSQYAKPASPSLSNPVLSRLLSDAAGISQVHYLPDCRYTLTPGEMLQHRCRAWFTPGSEHMHFRLFCQEWKAQVVRWDADGLFAFHVRLPTSFWRRWLGGQPDFEIQVRLARPEAADEALTEITVQIRPFVTDREQATRLLEEAGPVLLTSVRSYLQLSPERRREERLPFDRPVDVYPVQADPRLGQAIACQGIDISASGMGLWLPCRPPTPQLVIHLAADDAAAPRGIVAQVRRVGPSDRGGFEVGTLFIGDPSDTFTIQQGKTVRPNGRVPARSAPLA